MKIKPIDNEKDYPKAIERLEVLADVPGQSNERDEAEHYPGKALPESCTNFHAKLDQWIEKIGKDVNEVIIKGKEQQDVVLLTLMSTIR